MTPEISASFANSSGVKSSTPFQVTSGGQKTMLIVAVAAAAVLIVGLLVVFARK